MDGTVQILPNQCVMLHILNEILLRDVAHGKILDTVHRDNTNVLNGS